jgi:hypothetical protein
LQGSTGLAGTSVRTATFGDGIIWKAPVFRATEFRRKKSDLNAVFAQIKSDLGNGNTHSAAVITDMVATGDTTGGIQAAQSLLEWAQTSTSAGSASVGMLGVKARFWGVRDSKCKGSAKGAGCWFSEQTQVWTPLTTAVEVPLYVLIFGRSEAQVESVSAAMRRSLGLEGDKQQWEVLVRHQAARHLGFTCAYRNPDPAKPPRLRAVWADGSLRCPGSETFDLSCTVDDGDKGVVFAEDTKASWASVTATPSATGLDLSVSCERYKSRPPDGPLEVHGDALARPADEPWEKWTTASDETGEALGRTLRLKDFTSRVRSTPPVFDITCGPIFEVAQ